MIHYLLNDFDIFNGPSLASFSFILGLFNQTIKLLQQIHVKKVHPVLALKPTTSSPITTRPGLPPYHLDVCERTLLKEAATLRHAIPMKKKFIFCAFRRKLGEAFTTIFLLELLSKLG